MLVLYAIATGLLVGVLTGGSWSSLAGLRIRWSALIAISILLQIALFAEPVASRVGAAGPAIYVGSTILAILAVARNLAIPGVPLVLAGALSNMAAVLANGGYMPASSAALELAGRSTPSVYSNSSSVVDPALWPLTDLMALPSWIPLANVFSVGDVLIGLGLAILVVLGMRSRAAAHADEQLSAERVA